MFAVNKWASGISFSVAVDREGFSDVPGINSGPSISTVGVVTSSVEVGDSVLISVEVKINTGVKRQV